MLRRWLKRRAGQVVIVCATLLVLTSGALAHETKEIGEWRVVFGMTPEPVFTDQFYKTTWRFVDASGDPVTGLVDLSVIILKDGAPYGPFTVGPAHGNPGLYETPTIFAEPGDYRFILTGTDPNGGQFSIEFHKQVLDAAVITVGS